MTTNYYNNEVFGIGRIGIIQMRAGRELEVKASDTLRFNEDGDILITHGGDRFRTTTLVMRGNIGYIRTRDEHERHTVGFKAIDESYSDEELRELVSGDDEAPPD